MEFCSCQPVEIHCDVGQSDRMVFPGDAKANELEELIVAVPSRPHALIELSRLHAAKRDPVCQILLDLTGAGPKEIKRRVGVALLATFWVGVDIPPESASRCFQGTLGEDEGMAALEMGPFPFEMCPALGIDRTCYRIWKMRSVGIRIGGGDQADSFYLDHPARSQASENRVDLPGYFVALEVRSALAVGACEVPSGH